MFDRSTIERMTGWLTRLLEEVLADPGRPVSRARILDDAELRQVLGDPGEGNDVGREVPVGVCRCCSRSRWRGRRMPWRSCSRM
ncbi:protein of unknown function [Streptomyces murinus]